MAKEIKETRPATWGAVNGHLMEGQEVRWLDPETGTVSPWRTEGWSAQHSDECRCETGGADMPDW